jgi:serine/threonine protein kinase
MKIGDTIDKYLIIDDIGEGGMGFVLKVQNAENGNFYALKYCKETDEKSIKRFKREVKVVAETKHPNIIELIEHNLENIPPYFIMPIAKGNVNDIIDNIKGDFHQVMLIFEPMCKGITALHNSQKYHRDIKPRNILIMEDGSVVVTDFGLAKIINKDSSTHTSSNDFLGTYGYHAPEQFTAKNADKRTDVFQLGKSLYEMYTSEYPILIDQKKLPAGLVYIIQKATSPEPDDRYQSVSDLLQAINTYKKSLDPNKNPKDALDAKLLEINKNLKSGYYSEELCIELLDLLGNNIDNPTLFIDYFDKIPNQIIKILSSQLEDRFNTILNVYTKNLEEYFKENNIDFSYAEQIASKMSAIYTSTENINFKAIAIRNTLRSAVWCNRFNAMDTFNYLLRQIKDNDEASVISQILMEEIDLYKGLADQIADIDLHSTLVSTKNDALEIIEKEEKERIKEQEEMLKNLFK